MRHTDTLNLRTKIGVVPVEYSDMREPNDGVPALCAPGWGCPKSDFDAAAIALGTKGQRLITVAFPESVPLTVEDKATILGSVAGRIGLGRHAVIGHSLGGDVATEYASQHQDIVVGLASVMGNHRIEDRFLTRQVATMPLGEFLSGGVQRFLSPLLEHANAGLRRYGSRVADFDQNQLKAYHHAAVDAMERAKGGGSLHRFLNFSGYRVFIHGALEKAVYLEDIRQAGVPIIEIPDSDHFPNVDNPIAYNQALGSFMTEVDRLYA